MVPINMTSRCSKGPLRRILKYQQPQTADNEIPHQTKLCEDIMAKALVAEECIKNELKVIFTQCNYNSNYVNRTYLGIFCVHLVPGHHVPTILTQ